MTDCFVEPPCALVFEETGGVRDMVALLGLPGFLDHLGCQTVHCFVFLLLGVKALAVTD